MRSHPILHETPSCAYALIRRNLNKNFLSRSIPSELGKMAALMFITLSDNHLTGTLPTELTRQTKIRSLDLNQNALTGRLPSEMGFLTALTLACVRCRRGRTSSSNAPRSSGLRSSPPAHESMTAMYQRVYTLHAPHSGHGAQEFQLELFHPHHPD